MNQDIINQSDPIFDPIILPPHLHKNDIRKKYIDMPKLIKFSIPASNNISMYNDKNNIIKFDLSSVNFLDPYGLYLDLTIVNENINPIQLDSSAHSIIEKIQVYSNGELIDSIENYDLRCHLDFEVSLTKKQRIERREYEGFGYNEYGTNELIIDSAAQFSKLVSSAINVPYFLQDLKSSYVENGKLELINIHQKPNEYRFKIPLQLNSIGFGIHANNYKLVPLSIFGKITILIHLNPHAFFVPYHINYLSLEEQVSKFVSDNTNNQQNILMNANVSRKYAVTNVRLYTEQYQFNPKLHSSLISALSDWVVDIIFNDFVDKQLIRDSPYIELTRHLTSRNIKSMHVIFNNDLHKFSPFARKLVRYNMGISDFEFKQLETRYPPIYLDIKHNSLNTHGPINAYHMYEEFIKTIPLNEKPTNNEIISYKNWCIDNDYTHLIALLSLMLQNLYRLTRDLILPHNNATMGEFLQMSHNYVSLVVELLKMKQKINSQMTFDFNPKIYDIIPQFTSKCIYSLNYETIPFCAGLYRTDFSTDSQIPFYIKLERISDYLINGLMNKIMKRNGFINFYMTTIFQRYVTYRLTPRGTFEQIFL